MVFGFIRLVKSTNSASVLWNQKKIKNFGSMIEPQLWVKVHYLKWFYKNCLVGFRTNMKIRENIFEPSTIICIKVVLEQPKNVYF